MRCSLESSTVLKRFMVHINIIFLQYQTLFGIIRKHIRHHCTVLLLPANRFNVLISFTKYCISCIIRIFQTKYEIVLSLTSHVSEKLFLIYMYKVLFYKQQAHVFIIHISGFKLKTKGMHPPEDKYTYTFTCALFLLIVRSMLFIN